MKAAAPILAARRVSENLIIQVGELGNEDGAAAALPWMVE
jgi:hypothetical protein